jgi:hypothetical protein
MMSHRSPCRAVQAVVRNAHMRRLSLILALAGIVASGPVVAFAAPGDDAWGDGFGWPGVDNLVGTVASYHGDVIIGGRFTEAGGAVASHIARWDGLGWRPLGLGLASSTIDSPFVTSLAVYNDELIVGGYFGVAGGAFISNIARWNGTEWAPLGAGFDLSVAALAVVNGVLYAGGEFTSSGGTPLAHVARWDGSAWQPLGGGLDDLPRALIEYHGSLIAAGNFTRAGAVAANHVARWDGTSWSALGTGTDGGFAGRVTSLTVYHDELIAAGYFTQAGGTESHAIAAWNGASWHGVGGGVESIVYALAVYHDRLIAGGSFISAGPVALSEGIAQWDGTSWTALATRTGRTGGSTTYMSVFALAVHDDELVVAGDFDVASEVMAVGVARWDGVGWHPFGWGQSDAYYLSFVSCFAVYDGRVIIAGRLAHRQSTVFPSVDIRVWDGVTMDLLEWRVEASATPEVAALAVFGGELVAGGSFTRIGDVDASFLAAWDGRAWHALGASPDAPVQTLLVWNGGLIAAGPFTTIGGVAASHIARWDGSAWSPLGAGVNDAVACLVPFGGDLVAGGFFTAAGGVPASRIARWDGSAWSALGSGCDDLVRCAAVLRGDLVAGGRFVRAGGVEAAHIARWDGSAWSALGRGADDDVTALTAFHGDLFAGGFFLGAGDSAASAIARWDGASWHGLGSGLEDPDFRRPVAFAFLAKGDTLLVGGRFSLAGGKPAYELTSWSGAPSTPPPPPPTPTRVQLDANHPNPFAARTTFAFSLPVAGQVRFTVHDLQGRTVATLIDGPRPAGSQAVVWYAHGDDGRPADSGIYFACLESRGERKVRKIALIR